MGRIRLQVRVPPFQDSASTSSSAQARQNSLNAKPIKVVVSCDEDATLQDLNDMVVARWADIYVGYGTLKIKHFETYFGEVLAMYDRIGEFFDDRSTDDQSKDDGVPKTSIALLHRHPPDPAELHDVRRFGSLMPESAAIPRKRPLTITQQVHRDGFDGWGAEQPNSLRKRQRTQQAYDNEGLTVHQDEPILSREDGVGISRSSQTWGTQGSVHQVIDSQRSPIMDNHNPYGTPTSLSLISPQDRVLVNGMNVSVIPDSPACRDSRLVREPYETAADYQRESTKSESPELDSPIRDTALVDPAILAGEQVDRGIHGTQPAVTPDVSTHRVQTDHHSGSVALPSAVPDVSTHKAQTDQHSGSVALPSAVLDAKLMAKSTPIQHSMGASSANDDGSERQHTEHVSKMTNKSFKRKTPSEGPTLRGQAINGIKGDVYDPIESDSESFQEKQRMHSTKRLKIGKSIRGRLLSSDAPPSVSKEGADDDFAVPSLPASHFNRAGVRLGVNAKAGDRSTSVQERVHSFEDHRRSSENAAEDSERSENLSITGKVPGETHRPVGCATVQVDNRSTTTSDPHPSSIQEVGLSAADDSAVAEKRRQGRPELRAGELEDAIRTADGAKGMQTTEQNIMEERLIRERENKEKILAEEAGKLMIAADGARRLQAEKMEKKSKNGKLIHEVAAPRGTSLKASSYAETEFNEMLPSPINTHKSRSGGTVGKDTASKRPHLAESKSHNVEGSNGAVLNAHKEIKFKPRTEEQEARRIESATQKKAAEATVAEKRDPREATTVREQNLPALERSIPKFKACSEDGSCRSSTPSEPASIAGQRRKTMTPALPKSSLSTPSSTKNGILSSSPLGPISLNGLETPLRSSIRQGSSGLRRSVSFVDDPEDHLSGSKAATFLSPPMTQEIVETLTSIKNEPSFKTPTESKPCKPAISLKQPNRKASETNSGKKGKLQTKLNVTRHVAKGKGRESDASLVRELPASQAKQISSLSDDDSVSSFAAEAVGPNGSSKAGPSSRKPRGRMQAPSEIAADPYVLPDSLIDPEFRNITTSKDKALTPAPASNSLPERNPSTRSPALPLPERTSPDFSMTSISEYGPLSDPNDTSGSSLEGSDSSSVADDVKPQPSNLPRENINGASKVVSVEIRSPSITSRSQSSQFPSISSSRSRNLASSDDSSRVGDQAAKEQLRSELNQSLPVPKSGKRATEGNSAQGKPAAKPDQQIDRHGRLPNGIRPANYRYPSLSQLRKQSQADSIFNYSPVSKAPTPTSVGDIAAASHSSEGESSEDESSDLEDDETVNMGQPKIKLTSGGMSGLKGLIKLARSVSGLGR